MSRRIGGDGARAPYAHGKVTYVTFSDSDALAAEHDVVLCLEAGGAWNLSADSRGITA